MWVRIEVHFPPTALKYDREEENEPICKSRSTLDFRKYSALDRGF